MTNPNPVQQTQKVAMEIKEGCYLDNWTIFGIPDPEKDEIDTTLCNLILYYFFDPDEVVVKNLEVPERTFRVVGRVYGHPDIEDDETTTFDIKTINRIYDGWYNDDDKTRVEASGWSFTFPGTLYAIEDEEDRVYFLHEFRNCFIPGCVYPK